ncbi:hypothetical protein HUU40_02855 [candidate division KSB1 bacterium]|nr:hypothetical protein [candidate division KSB1 bacterium]
MIVLHNTLGIEQKTGRHKKLREHPRPRRARAEPNDGSLWREAVRRRKNVAEFILAKHAPGGRFEPIIVVVKSQRNEFIVVRQAEFGFGKIRPAQRGGMLAAEARGMAAPECAGNMIEADDAHAIVGKAVAGGVGRLPLAAQNIIARNAGGSAEKSLFRTGCDRADVAIDAVAHPIARAVPVICRNATQRESI